MRLVPHQGALTPPSRPDGCAFGFFKGAFAWISTGAGACRSPCGKHVKRTPMLDLQRISVSKIAADSLLCEPPISFFGRWLFLLCCNTAFRRLSRPIGAAEPVPYQKPCIARLLVLFFECRRAETRRPCPLKNGATRPLPAVKPAGAMPPFGLSHRHIHFCGRSGRSLWRAGTTRSASGEGCGRRKATQGWRSACCVCKWLPGRYRLAALSGGKARRSRRGA